MAIFRQILAKPANNTTKYKRFINEAICTNRTTNIFQSGVRCRGE